MKGATASEVCNRGPEGKKPKNDLNNVAQHNMEVVVKLEET